LTEKLLMPSDHSVGINSFVVLSIGS